MRCNRKSDFPQGKLSSIQLQTKKSIGTSVERNFYCIDIYLWFHGVGFSPNCNALATVISVLLAALYEGNLVISVYHISMRVYQQGLDKSRRQVALTVFMILNSVIRFLFYIRKKPLARIARKLARIYGKVAEEGASMKNFTIKMVALMAVSDVISLSCTAHFFIISAPLLVDSFHFGTIPPPFSIPCFYLSNTLVFHSFVLMAVAAYFCSICFVLKECLASFKGRFIKTEGKNEYFISFCDEVGVVIRRITTELHSFLLTSFICVLSMVFHHTYYAVFSLDGLDALILFVVGQAIFANFIFMCSSSSSVMDAAAELRNMSQNSLPALSSSKIPTYYLKAKTGFPAFKILDSVTIDLSLIPTAVDVLITYGVMIATFGQGVNTNG